MTGMSFGLAMAISASAFTITGKVSDEGGKAVEGIKTSVKQVTNYEGKPITFAIDSVLTDANGHYDMTSTHFPQSPEIKLIVEDVDGDTNGAYQNDTIDINYNNAQKVKDGEGTWNNGTFTIKQDIKLKKK